MTATRRYHGACCVRAAGLLLATTLAIGAGAQQAENLTIEASECVALVTPEERLACFDAQVERSRQGGSPRPVSGSPASVTPPAAGSHEVTSPADATAGFPRESRRRADPAVPLVIATVTALRETVPNSYLVTLDNGQVWRQVQPMRYLLRVGMAVQIYPPPWGSTLRLKATDLSGYIQVERVR